MNWHPRDEVRSSGWSRIPERQTMTVEELRTLPDGAVVRGGLYVYQKHSGRFKAWFCVDGHTAERMTCMRAQWQYES